MCACIASICFKTGSVGCTGDSALSRGRYGRKPSNSIGISVSAMETRSHLDAQTIGNASADVNRNALSSPVASSRNSNTESTYFLDSVSVADGSPQAVEEPLQPWYYLRRRAKEECNLLRKQWRMFVFCIICNIYGGGIVFRNIAFYLYIPGERLPDLGFQLLPEKKGRFTPLPMISIQIMCGIMALLTFVPRRTNPPYLTNMWRRWLAPYAISNILRFLTYVSTGLPGSGDHCLPSKNNHIGRDKPQKFADVFTRVAYDAWGGESMSGTYNCGDLTPSGHVLMSIFSALTLLRYLGEVMLLPSRVMRVVRVVVWILIGLQSTFIVMARNHYTVDVVVSLYLGPLVWNWYINNLDPEEMKPDELTGPDRDGQIQLEDV
eukprot:TRINITY_DN2056_c0_g1_i1.p1 TRINITY_DN2056_c0_g1~~TRINITY_DN2056_c0_g1_i1.p1  ORF type:complete len:378 (-),score=23.75 TRINITY_DN2056_c0_g1_i1:103-1236(-)